MNDREKVIDNLEYHINLLYDVIPHVSRDDGEYLEAAAKTMSDAIILLKAQEPRILRLDELSGNDTAYIEINNLREPVLHCIIYYDKEADGMDVKPIKTNISSAYLRYSEHNRVWRPWTSRPSDAQREATPWG